MAPIQAAVAGVNAGRAFLDQGVATPDLAQKRPSSQRYGRRCRTDLLWTHQARTRLRQECICGSRLTQELELKAHALSLLQERIAGSESAQLAEAVSALEADLAAAKDAAAAAKARKAEMAASAKVSRP